MRVLMLYASTEGQTEKIARFIAGEVKVGGHQVDLFNLNHHQPAPVGYDRVIVGASLHMAKYQAAVTHYLRNHADMLNKQATAFISVSLTAASHDKDAWDDLEEITSHFMDSTGWRPLMVLQVAGALKYTQYDFFKRWVMRSIAKKEGRSTDTSQDYEYTDWVDLRKFVEAFVRSKAAKATA